MPEPQMPRTLAVIVDGPVTPAAERQAIGAGCALHRPGQTGATLRFEGVVRGEEPREGGVGVLAGLEYQTYDPMARAMLAELAGDVAERHGLIGLAALHSRGRVEVGLVSFVLIVESAHRAEALAAMSEFIDRLKRDVPIWKRPVWA